MGQPEPLPLKSEQPAARSPVAAGNREWLHSLCASMVVVLDAYTPQGVLNVCTDYTAKRRKRQLATLDNV
jgi:hypothetical protein